MKTILCISEYTSVCVQSLHKPDEKWSGKQENYHKIYWLQNAGMCNILATNLAQVKSSVKSWITANYNKHQQNHTINMQPSAVWITHHIKNSYLVNIKYKDNNIFFR